MKRGLQDVEYSDAFNLLEVLLLAKEVDTFAVSAR